MKKPTIKERIKKTVSDFKSFAFKGSAIDIAIGMMIGAAMTAVVDSLIKDIVNPPIAKLISGIDFSHRYLVLGKNQYESLEAAQEAGAIVITYGNFITAIITFLITALVLFIIVSWVSKLNKKEEEKAEKTTKKCPYCKSEIDMDATRCAFCTSELKK
ncbi:MAG TPA: large conductance mechanosensitive channel protein MscL [Candidatus Dojkabacteria bacterium]|jgi:large conductance mechanosensitive channel|nr:large conductance mechanosensitive channel protein MscL [Candidatus Dojkabacteria bacterium]